MEHPCIKLGIIKAKNPYKLQRFFNIHFWKGKKYSIRLSLNRNFQATHKLLNCSASIMFSLPKDAYDPYNELKSLRKKISLKRLLKLSGSAKSILKSLWAYFFDRFYYKANADITLSIMMEQEPLSDSYISTSEDRDEFGIKQALLNWKISNSNWHTTVISANALKKEIERSGFGDVILYPHINSETKNWSDLLTDVCHHMGGCRMSALPQDGVVDENLQVWNEANVYVCSQAVFPTSSHSNPVLTMLALGYRLADHLCEKKAEPVSKNYAYNIS
jgi:choline dehydrogenase-like flavoprotein